MELRRFGVSFPIIVSLPGTLALGPPITPMVFARSSASVVLKIKSIDKHTCKKCKRTIPNKLIINPIGGLEVISQSNRSGVVTSTEYNVAKLNI